MCGFLTALQRLSASLFFKHFLQRQKGTSAVKKAYIFVLSGIIYTNLFAVFRVGEMNEVIIVHFLGVDDVTVLLLTQVLWVNSIGSEELLVGHAEGLTYGLSNELGLKTKSQAASFSLTGCHVFFRLSHVFNTLAE